MKKSKNSNATTIHPLIAVKVHFAKVTHDVPRIQWGYVENESMQVAERFRKTFDDFGRAIKKIETIPWEELLKKPMSFFYNPRFSGEVNNPEVPLLLLTKIVTHLKSKSK